MRQRDVSSTSSFAETSRFPSYDTFSYIYPSNIKTNHFFRIRNRLNGKCLSYDNGRVILRDSDDTDHNQYWWYDDAYRLIRTGQQEDTRNRGWVLGFDRFDSPHELGNHVRVTPLFNNKQTIYWDGTYLRNGYWLDYCLSAQKGGTGRMENEAVTFWPCW